MTKISIAKSRPNNLTLPGMEQALCKCGCGHYFMRSTGHRKREYVNDTHKKRAARKRLKLARTESTARLAPKGWMYLDGYHLDRLDSLWESFTPVQRALIHAACEGGFSAEQMWEAARMLFDPIPF